MTFSLLTWVKRPFEGSQLCHFHFASISIKVCSYRKKTASGHLNRGKLLKEKNASGHLSRGKLLQEKSLRLQKQFVSFMSLLLLRPGQNETGGTDSPEKV